MKRWTVERCEHVASVYSNKKDVNINVEWVIDCWQTMGEWLKAHPDLTDAQSSAVWDFICERKEGHSYKVG